MGNGVTLSGTTELPVSQARGTAASLRLAIPGWRRRLADWLAAGKTPGPYTKLGLALFLFLLSFSIRALQSVDLSPVIYTEAQPGRGMSAEYDRDAKLKLNAGGLLMPGNWDSADTSLLARAPGYSIFLSAVYSGLGASYFYVQMVQNVVNSISPVLICLIAASLIGWRVGFVAGILAALSHHLSYYSNLVLPDSVAALPILIAVYLLVLARGFRMNRPVAYVLAGSLFGIATWLRANLLLMGPLMAVIVIFVGTQGWREIRRAWLMALMPFFIVAPITIRNYLVFHRFVPISENMGIVLWEGIGDAGGAEFGAQTSDRAVAEQEAALYGDPRYSESWATPDGITRDRDRIRRSLAVITRHPFWFAKAAAGRMIKMVSYVAEADLIRRTPPDRTTDEPPQAGNEKPEKAERRRQNALFQEMASRRTLAFGEAVGWARPAARLLQRVAKETAEPFIFLGLAFVLILAPRRAVLLMGVPVYYLLVQSTMHLEFRYTLPMHYFLFVLAATVWVLIGTGLWRLLKSAAGCCRERLS